MAKSIFLLIHIFVFACGTVVNANYSSKKLNPSETFHSNIVKLDPFKAFDEAIIGFSFGYEKILGKAGRWSLALPFIITDENLAIFKNDAYPHYSYFAAPGIKFYPFGQKSISYSLGVHLFYGFGKWVDMTVSPFEEIKKVKNGLLLNNAFGISPNKRLTVGVEFGYGFKFQNSMDIRNLGSGRIQHNSNRNQNLTFAYGVGVGYRFF